MKYYIADCHFHDEKVWKLDQRPFASVEEMDAVMIEKWNEKVRKNRDEVYILGDFCSGKGPMANELLRKLRGKKYLITGNHDSIFLYDKQFDRELFQWIKPYAELTDQNQPVVLSHYPMICYQGQYFKRKSYMLYGHVHDSLDYQNVRRFVKETRETYYQEEKRIACNLINCFTGFSGFQPLTLEEWISLEERGMDNK